MKIELRQLMDDNELLSHIFLGCIETEDLIKIKEKYIGEKDWKKESVKIPVEMKIGNVSVNPKKLFDQFQNQMTDMIQRSAKEMVAEKLSEKTLDIQNKLTDFEEILKSWEEDINWDVKNPLN